MTQNSYADSNIRWIYPLPAILFVALYFAVPGDALWRVSLGFALATLVNLVALGAVTLRRRRP